MRRIARIVIVAPLLLIGVVALTLIHPIVMFFYWALGEPLAPGSVSEMWREYWELIW